MYQSSLAAMMLLLLLSGAFIAPASAEPPMGEWEVTLDGQITLTTKDSVPPSGLCEVGTVIHVANDGDSFIRLSTHSDGAGMAEQAADAMKRIILDHSGKLQISADDVPAVDPTHLFIFSFEFDNGMKSDDYEYELNYHTNEVLEAEASFDAGSFQLTAAPQVAVRRDAAEQSSALSGMPGGGALAALNAAFGGVEGYVGTWFAVDDELNFAGRTTRIFGMEAIQSGGGDSGKSLFLVTGSFVSDQLIRGEWDFVENSQLFDCTSSATGKGTWEAKPS